MKELGVDEILHADAAVRLLSCFILVTMDDEPIQRLDQSLHGLVQSYLNMMC